MMNKKGAMEFSITTIIVIVLAVTLLVFGMIFVRNVMCAGITITDQIDVSLKNQLISLFGVDDYGVKCMGEGGQEVVLGDGGKRQIFCLINTNEQTNYEFTASVTSLSGTPDATVQKWIIDKDWKGAVAPGQKTVTIMVWDIPEKVSKTNLKVEIIEKNADTGTTDMHTSYIDIEHVSGLTSAVC
ncbi:MAG: hypothetical protein KKA64_03010 [Nanoarchaeota archaeon]|nr:hypothetical protein [Nanoarchaeota archaeon]